MRPHALLPALLLTLLAAGTSASHPETPLDSRCDTHSCSQLRLDDGVDPGNVFDTQPGADAPQDLYWGSSAVWTSNSDGAGSGLDADRLDGQQGSFYRDAGNLDAGTLAVARGGTGTGTAFTAGSLVFAGAGGAYAQDNPKLFWDDANDRLGVGTLSPQARLSVDNKFLVDSAGRVNVGTPPSLHALYSANLNNGAIRTGYDVGGSVFNPAAGTTGAFFYGNAYATPPAGASARFAGLEVADIAVGNVAGTFSELVGVSVGPFTTKGALATVENQYSAHFRLPTNGANNKIGVLVGGAPAGPVTASLYVASGTTHLGGDVGIGTATPSAKLDVAGSIRGNSLDLNDQSFGTCDSSLRGTMRLDEGGSGTADVLKVCIKSAADSYAWVTVATG